MCYFSSDSANICLKLVTEWLKEVNTEGVNCREVWLLLRQTLPILPDLGYVMRKTSLTPISKSSREPRIQVSPRLMVNSLGNVWISTSLIALCLYHTAGDTNDSKVTTVHSVISYGKMRINPQKMCTNFWYWGNQCSFSCIVSTKCWKLFDQKYQVVSISLQGIWSYSRCVLEVPKIRLKNDSHDLKMFLNTFGRVSFAPKLLKCFTHHLSTTFSNQLCPK